MYKFTIRHKDKKFMSLNKYTLITRGTKAGYRASNQAKKNEETEVKNALAQTELLGIKDNLKYPVHIVFTWIEPNKRRDLDNISFAKKFIIDALVRSDVLIDDGWSYVAGHVDRFKVDKEDPRVVVEIYEDGEMMRSD